MLLYERATVDLRCYGATRCMKHKVGLLEKGWDIEKSQ